MRGDSPDEDSPMPRLLALGISIGLVTGFVQSLGLTLQRKAQYDNLMRTYS
jgi:hypothetical protein